MSTTRSQTVVSNYLIRLGGIEVPLREIADCGVQRERVGGGCGRTQSAGGAVSKRPATNLEKPPHDKCGLLWASARVASMNIKITDTFKSGVHNSRQKPTHWTLREERWGKPHHLKTGKGKESSLPPAFPIWKEMFCSTTAFQHLKTLQNVTSV